MDRREFLRQGTVAAGLAASKNLLPAIAAGPEAHDPQPLPKRRLGKTGVDLSIIGLGGIVVREAGQAEANSLVAEAVDHGVNYFDVAPSYGHAEERFGPALEPYRQRIFLACKTLKRDKASAAAELENSLKTLRTDHLDLYQSHALSKLTELEQIMGPNGAMETFQAARKAGKIRFLGFSSHSVETALAALDRFDFDTILFPLNYVCFSQANFGPQVLERARQKGMGILAIKALAPTKWPESFKERPLAERWYQPEAAPDIASLALRWALAQPITAAVPRGEVQYFRLAQDVARRYAPLADDEHKTLMALAVGAEPLFKLGSY